METTSKTAQKESGFSKIVILILLFLGWCLGNMDRLAMSYGVVPIGKEFNLSSSLVGLVLSSSSSATSSCRSRGDGSRTSSEPNGSST